MKNVLVIEDISQFGKCSTTVGLPIISACGVTASILPTSILSTHTGPAFPGFTFLDLFQNMKETIAHWVELGIKFDAVYTGYLGRLEHVDLVLELIPQLLKEDGLVFIDPAFADQGEFYPGFDKDYAKAQLRLLEVADYILPNLSEACLMLDLEYKALSSHSEEDFERVAEELLEHGAKHAIITGFHQGHDEIGAYLKASTGEVYKSLGELQHGAYHGTGDVFASVVVGRYMRTGDIQAAIAEAVNFVPEAIKATQTDEDPITYGVHFEKCLHLLTK